MAMKTHKAVVDNSSSFIKAANKVGDEIKTVLFPSRVVNKAQSDPNTETGFSVNSYRVNGENYAVVQDGSRSGEVMKTNTLEFQTSPENCVLIHHALRKLGITGKATIMITLPASMFFDGDQSRDQETIDLAIENAKREIEYLDGTKAIEIETVYVMPEGLPAFQHAKTTLGLGEGRYFICDLGGTTLDTLDIQDGAIIDAYSHRIGSLETMKKFKQMVEKKLRVEDVSDTQALNGILTGTCFHTDFSEEAAAAIGELNKSVFNKVLTDNKHLQYNSVIFSGGGSVLLNTDHIHNAVKTEDPQFDNCLGGLAILESVEG